MAKASHYLNLEIQLEYLRRLKNMGLLNGQQVDTKLQVPEIKFPNTMPKSKQEK